MAADPAVEEPFGPYLVYERLGVGGMATVHRALERGVEGFERVVALKRLLPHLAEDASFIKSFVREAKLASLLNHVNIVQIYELGRVGTEYFISMEYVDGRDVRRVLRHARKVTGPPPIHVTVGLMLQLCDALDYAHSKGDDDGLPLGLVHRDVSPSNLLVTTGGHLKVIDFGIAKAQSSQLRTQTGRVKGKLAYMAPEAISGSKELDARSDLWAVGVILHELLTARPLFASKNEYQTLIKVQRGDIMPPSTFNQGSPPELDAITFKALARDPDDRFANAGELREELFAVRKMYQLKTGYRDVAAWLEWAFSLEVPAGFTGNTIESTGVSDAGNSESQRIRAKTPRRPRNRDEDEAVEMVWGTAEGEGQSGPIVLDDIPDVSEKHLSLRLDTGDGDDIPTPQPSHGARASRQSDPAPERRSDRHVRSTSQGVVARPARAQTATADVPNVSDRMIAQRARDSRPPPVPARRETPIPRTESMVRTDPDGLPVAGLDPDELFGPDAAAETLVEPPSGKPPPAPVVRFSNTAPIPIVEAPAGPEPLRAIPRTKPGIAAPIGPSRSRARTPEDSILALGPEDVKKRPAPPPITIGASMVARNKPRRGLLLVVGLVVAGGAATGVTLFATRGADTVTSVKEPAPRVPAQAAGMVKFEIEPIDTEIRIEGQLVHTGSPWTTELDAGIHQIELHHNGYKTWLTSIELSARETQTLHIMLDHIGNAATGEATLAITTTPSGLDVVVDGQALPEHTPIKVMIKTGPHAIAIRQGGIEVWHQHVEAEASSVYEFNPSFTADKQRERIERASDPRPVKRTPPRIHEPTAVEPEVAPPEPDHAEPTPEAKPAPDLPPAVAPIPTPTPAPPPTPVAPPARIATPPARVSTAPVLVAPSAVTKLSGESPNIAKLKNVDLPPVVAAKVCIDATGNVMSADIVNKIEHHAALDLTDTLRTWKYAPYRKDGAATAACFVVSFRLK